MQSQIGTRLFQRVAIMMLSSVTCPWRRARCPPTPRSCTWRPSPSGPPPARSAEVWPDHGHPTPSDRCAPANRGRRSASSSASSASARSRTHAGSRRTSRLASAMRVRRYAVAQVAGSSPAVGATSTIVRDIVCLPLKRATEQCHIPPLDIYWTSLRWWHGTWGCCQGTH